MTMFRDRATGEMALSTPEIIDRLTLATADLDWISETDARFEVIAWGIDSPPNLTAKKLLKWMGSSSDAAIVIVDLDTFFQPVVTPQDWHEAAEKANIQRYENLSATLQANLTDLRVYRLGTTEVTICIVGKSPDSQWVALKTQAIET
jgi:Nuclease A inhibitor-like protein